MITLGELIKKKDYDKIDFRIACDARESGSAFYGTSQSKNGKLIESDDDYSDELRLTPKSYEEWSKPEKNIKNGLTVVFSSLTAV